MFCENLVKLNKDFFSDPSNLGSTAEVVQSILDGTPAENSGLS